jgi:hypothetical protein
MRVSLVDAAGGQGKNYDFTTLLLLLDETPQTTDKVILNVLLGALRSTRIPGSGMVAEIKRQRRKYLHQYQSYGLVSKFLLGCY